mgnify:CR=1 FL=1
MDKATMELRIKEHVKEIQEAHILLSQLHVGLEGMDVATRIRELAGRSKIHKDLEVRNHIFDCGKREGKEKTLRAIIEALGLDERYEFKKEDE